MGYKSIADIIGLFSFV